MSTRDHKTVPRRSILLGIGAGAVSSRLVLVPSEALAEDAPVPAALQMKLLVKVAGYDKGLPDRAGAKARVAIVRKAGDSDSEHIAEQARAALGDYEEIAGLPLEVSTLEWKGAGAVKAAISSDRLAVVYFASGFDDADVDAIVKALDGVDVLSAAAVPTTVPRGIVLGFDLVSSKPKLLLQLSQARKQNVQLPADVIKLARVYE